MLASSAAMNTGLSGSDGTELMYPSAMVLYWE